MKGLVGWNWICGHQIKIEAKSTEKVFNQWVACHKKPEKHNKNNINDVLLLSCLSNLCHFKPMFSFLTP